MSLREKLAALEHDQWVEWAKVVEAEVSPERRKRWQKYYVPYDELDEEVKDQDRVWADKILAVIFLVTLPSNSSTTLKLKKILKQ